MRGSVQQHQQQLPQQPQQQQQPQLNGHHSELNINDVLEVIRHSDPATFQEFHSQLSAMAASGGAGAAAAAVKAQLQLSAEQLNKQKKQAYVKITEQPASKGLRFRYECEGRSAGSIPGANTTGDNKTYPTIQIMGYKGRAVVVVSCVSSDPPHRPHPHSLVGKEGCKKGVCTLEIPTDTMSLSFQSLGIQCVKKKEIEDALTLRQQIRVDPFQTGFAHRENTQSLDLNSVRLCFQVFLEGNEKGAFTFALKPVVSDPIFDKKAKNDLTICRITDCSASVAGGKEMLLFCDKVIKDDIQVRFFQEDPGGKVIWEGFGDFQPSDVHKQYGIAFRTPRYHNLEIEDNVKVHLQLRRPSDGAVSDPRPFEYLPLDSGRSFWSAKRLKTNYNIFNSILSVDQEQLKRKSRVLQPQPSVAATTTAPPAAEASATTSPGSQMTSSFPPPPPPARNFHSLSLVPHANTLNNNNVVSATATSPEAALVLQQQQQQLQILQLQQQQQQQQIRQLQQPQLQLPPKAATMNLRPLSAASDLSEASVATVASKQSVNDILSLAGKEENMSVYSVDINQALEEPAGQMSFQALMKLEPQPSTAGMSGGTLTSMGTTTTAGSMTSVATVKENPSSAAAAVVKQERTSDAMDVDVAALYDDVMQCVYDDVDTKYDGVELTEPPPPPARRKNMSLDVEGTSSTSSAQQESSADPMLSSPDKPLPGTPSKLPTILQMMTGGGGGGGSGNKDTLKKKREQEELKKRYKEEEKQKQKEEKEKKKVERRIKKEQQPGGGKGSLFQRVLSRSKSQSELADAANANNDSTEEASSSSGGVQLSSHNSAVVESALKLSDEGPVGGDANANGVAPAGVGLGGEEPTEADLSELQKFLDSGNLDHLDNMVNEFAKQYLPDETGAAASPGNNNNCSSAQQQQQAS